MASSTAILYMAHHVFLPPKLPDEDDSNFSHDMVLLDTVIEVLSKFGHLITPSDSESTNTILNTIQNVKMIHSARVDGAVDQEKLQNALQNLHASGGTIALHIRAQNAGVLITKVDPSRIHVEVFELSPNNEAVMATQGRLKRQFPASAVSFNIDEQANPGLQAMLAHTLAEMSCHAAVGTRPKARKAGQLHDEDRDTIHPKLVTELLIALLRPLGQPVVVSAIGKHTREDVVWHDSRRPWRRSPLWLLVRVTLQLMWFRMGNEFKVGFDSYKTFMILFMARVSELARDNAIADDMLYVMKAKISRRLLKMDPQHAQTLVFAINMVDNIDQLLGTRWKSIREHDAPQPDLTSLKALQFQEDCYHTLPTLDKHIQSSTLWKNTTSPTDVQSRSVFVEFQAAELPVLSRIDRTGDKAVYVLCAFETWVELHLDSWLDKNKADARVTERISKLIPEYHQLARSQYCDNPEALSRMLLNILELWIACDQSAVHHCDLLNDYDPTIPTEPYQSLLLPTYQQMHRLLRAENYINVRRQRARYASSGIFKDFGQQNCFSVKYFEQSSDHEQFLKIIEADAHQTRVEKCNELRNKQERYRQLMESYNYAVCEYEEVVLDWESGRRENRHKQGCLKCGYLSQAKAIEIQVHEWPVPRRRLEAESVVFELRVPGPFGYWRDTTTYVIIDVLRYKYASSIVPRSHHTLTNYHGLSKYHSSFGEAQRLGLLSQTKPHVVTHRAHKTIDITTEDDVCLHNGLQYQYYDNKLRSFTDDFLPTQQMAHEVTLPLPDRSRSLRQYLFRPASMPDGLSPNTVIASQSDCPDHMSREEYKAFASLGLGHRIQWQNILVQIAAPSIDFRKVETTLIILQIIHQAGLPNDRVARASHDIVQRKDFAYAMFQSVSNAYDRVKDNWESSEALTVLISITLRILSLNSDDAIVEQCLALLATFRTTAFGWTTQLQDKSYENDSDTERNDFAQRSIEMALICVQSFHIDKRYLARLVGNELFASIFIQCSIIIQDGLLSISGSVSSVTKMLRHQWKILSYRLCPLLATSIVAGQSSSLDEALIKAWPAYRAGSSWQKAPGTVGDWLVCNTNHQTPLEVRINLLTGALLVGGLPLSRLPAEYENTTTYKWLFGRRVLDVMPSSTIGMQFSAKRKHCGHELHFGMDYTNKGNSPDIRVLAIKQNRRRILIPRRVLQNYFPAHFCDEYLHWYDSDADAVEFCPINDVWTSSKANWWLRKCSDRRNWHLRRDATVLVNIHSRTAQMLTEIFAPVEDATRIHIIFHSSRSIVDIDIPRLRLTFYLSQGRSMLQSRQFRSMNLDANQDVGTLVGLRSKLVLHCPNDDSRILMIPEGSPSCMKHSDHVRVEIARGDRNRVHTYRVDSVLGRLIDNGSLLSKLLLSYLHALTSYCMPDPLTSKTGTEQALSILRSASVRSFDLLTRNDIALLDKIAHMTPTRNYYPANERVMQSVKWSPTTSFLSQHGAFFTAVQNIFDQAERAQVFYPQNRTDIPRLQHVHPDLLKRDCIRSSAYYVADYGAEEHTTDYDMMYTGRDKNQESAAAARSFSIASFVLQEQPYLPFPPPVSSSSYLWAFLARRGDTLGPEQTISDHEIMFSVQTLQKPFDLVLSHWATLHRKLSRRESRPSKYSLAAWLSTMAFAADSDVHVIQALGSFFIFPEMAPIQAPVEKHFHLRIGATMQNQKLREIIDLQAKAFGQCPESNGVSRWTASSVRATSHATYQKKRAQSTKHVLDSFTSQWPCRSPQSPRGDDTVNIHTYLNMQNITNAIRIHFEAVYDNGLFLAYLKQIESFLSRCVVRSATLASVKTVDIVWNTVLRPRHISVHDMLTSEPPSQLPDAIEAPNNMPVITTTIDATATVRLAALIDRLDAQGTSAFEKKYYSELRLSLESLRSRQPSQSLSASTEHLWEVLTKHRDRCNQQVREYYSLISNALLHNSTLFPEEEIEDSLGKALQKHFSRWSPAFFIQLLRRDYYKRLSTGWKKAVVRYAVSLTSLQQANRMIKWVKSPLELMKELQNLGHSNWDPTEYPESLLLEVESELMIREPQERIAKEMRSPRSGKSAVVQLNMGDGKSSVIVPIVAVALADTSQLVRVIVAKPQAKQMFQMLLLKLGGFLNRRIYYLPFSRELKLDEKMAKYIQALCDECMREGGVLLVQPEHLLSFKLMGLECMISGKSQIGRTLMHTLQFYDEFARDIVDESDEIFSVKFELIYGMGSQQPIELSPERWLYHQKVLDLVPEAAARIDKDDPSLVELQRCTPGSFPRIRLLQEKAQSQLTHLIAEKLCTTGLHGLPIAQQTLSTRDVVQKYISSLELTASDIAQMESSDSDSFWTDTTKEVLLLLRGLLAIGTLAFVLSQKRWRVNYGLDSLRRPATRLAVPYRAKDSPSMRAEFSHPDVAILLTSLSYYYGGLNDEDMFLTFSHLMKSDQADIEYQLWIKDISSFPSSFRQLVGINLKDRVLCTTQIFPNLRFAKAVVDYFLAHIVFPKEMREFPQKLTASGWDIGESRSHPTTGFSGTIDSRKTLPLSLHFEDLPEQQHTNALVLSCLLRPENEVLLMPSQSGVSDVTALLNALASMEKAPRVILDVGAQIVDVDNFGVAQKWLEMSPDHEAVQAVVFFNDHDELNVLDREGRTELLQMSSFASQLDVCLVYLDEAHTRGTDLKLPDHYRAAVALGPRVTKDRLIQACMRMRKLGQGQAVVFCVPDEVKNRIMDCTHKNDGQSLYVSDVLHWSMTETYADLCRAMPLWAMQGRRFKHQTTLWKASGKHGKRHLSQSQAIKFLEKESMTLEYRYRPGIYENQTYFQDPSPGKEVDAIENRYREFDVPQSSLVSLQRDQEQERELACEVEQERQIQKPPPASPLAHRIHPDLVSFITTGSLRSDTEACQPAFEALRDISAAKFFNIQHFPSDLWTTCDFARTIQAPGHEYVSDLYHRSVQWILVGGCPEDINVSDSGQRVIIISPYEAQQLLPQIEVSQHVTLHLYAPRPNLGFRPLDTLKLFSTSANVKHRVLPHQVIMLLNLFSGQVYFDSYTEYVEMCNFVGVNWKPTEVDERITADEFIIKTGKITNSTTTFSKSPIKFLATFMTKVRKNDESIENTHIGKLFGGVLLHPKDLDPATDGA